MRFFVLLIAAWVGSLAFAGQDDKVLPDDHCPKGRQLFAAEKWQQTLLEYQKCLKSGSQFYRWRLFAQVARAQAMLGQKEQAFKNLENALEARYQERDEFRKDPHLRSLRSDPRFTKIAGLPPKDIKGRINKWKYDLKFYKDDVYRLHPNPFFRVTKKEFEDRFRKIEASLPYLTDEEIIIELQKFSGFYGDGHTNGHLYRFDMFLNNLVPFRFAFLEGDLYIIEGAPGFEKYAGSRVEQVGKTKRKDIFKNVIAAVGRENNQWPKEFGPLLLRIGHFLKSVTGSKSANHFDMILRMRGGKQKKISVKTGSHLFFKGGPKKQIFTTTYYPPQFVKNVPLWLQNAEKHFWLKELGSTLYVQVNICHNMPNETLADFAKRVRIAQKGKTTLVVDLRANPGGDGFQVMPIIDAIVDFDKAQDDHKVHAIIGQRTFSAGGSFTRKIKNRTRAVFWGEPTGASPNGYGETTRVLLPFADVWFSVSSHGPPTSDKRALIPSFEPDHYVPLTAKDYFAGRDPVLEKILRK